jgi:hypothetical protein
MTQRPADEALADAIRRAKTAGRAADRREPRALSARYDGRTRRVVVELRDGCAFAFPVEQTEGLKGAAPDLLRKVEVLGGGYALRWETLDVDYTVPGLLAGRLGSRRWMAKVMGEVGGRSRSAAKVRASRRNGRKGGRPRGS